MFWVPSFTWIACFHVTFRNEDRDERSRKASYDVKDGTADCEDWYVGFTAGESQIAVRPYAPLNSLIVAMAAFHLQPQAHAGWGALLGTVLRQADVLSGREELFPTVSPHRVQRGEHALLASVWRVHERDKQECGGGEGPGHLRGLHLHPLT